MKNRFARLTIISIEIAIVGVAWSRSETGIAAKHRPVQGKIFADRIRLAPDFKLSKREELRWLYVQSFQPHKPALQAAHVTASPRKIGGTRGKIGFHPNVGPGIVQQPQTKIAHRMLSM